jgi:hypothetical protein
MDSTNMMKIMSSISVENWTMWTSVYNLATGEFQVAYRRKYQELYPESVTLFPGESLKEGLFLRTKWR